jgi:hypothetical protein
VDPETQMNADPGGSEFELVKLVSCKISIPILPVEHGPDVVGIARLILDGVVSVRIELDQNDDAVGRLGELVRRLLSCGLPKSGLPSLNIRQGFQYFDRTE